MSYIFIQQQRYTRALRKCCLLCLQHLYLITRCLMWLTISLLPEFVPLLCAHLVPHA